MILQSRQKKNEFTAGGRSFARIFTVHATWWELGVKVKFARRVIMWVFGVWLRRELSVFGVTFPAHRVVMVWFLSLMATA